MARQGQGRARPGQARPGQAKAGPGQARPKCAKMPPDAQKCPRMGKNAPGCAKMPPYAHGTPGGPIGPTGAPPQGAWGPWGPHGRMYFCCGNAEGSLHLSHFGFACCCFGHEGAPLCPLRECRRQFTLVMWRQTLDSLLLRFATESISKAGSERIGDPKGTLVVEDWVSSFLQG